MNLNCSHLSAELGMLVWLVLFRWSPFDNVRLIFHWCVGGCDYFDAAAADDDRLLPELFAFS